MEASSDQLDTTTKDQDEDTVDHSVKKAKIDTIDETDSSAPALGLTSGLPKMDISFGSASAVSKMLLGGGETILEKVFDEDTAKETSEKESDDKLEATDNVAATADGIEEQSAPQEEEEKMDEGEGNFFAVFYTYISCSSFPYMFYYLW